MALIAQPWRHPSSGMYYLRRFVPFDLRPLIGRVEIRRSLGTKDFRQAKALFADAYAATEHLFFNARQNGYVSVASIQDLGKKGCPEAPNKPHDAKKPHSPPCITPHSKTTPQLSQLVLRYAESLTISCKPEHVRISHEAQLRKVVDRFIELLGDVAVAAITPANIQFFATELAKVPVIGGRTAKSASIAELKKLAKTGTPTLSPATVRVSVARFSSFLSFAVESGHITSNPVTASRILRRLDAAKPKRQLDDNKGYSWPELVTIFSSPDFKALRNAQGRPGNAVYWLPLIAAYTGARREEISQLYISDVKCDDSGRWFIRIIDDKPDKSIKTDSSRRDIPIHSDLIELGFVELVQGQPPTARVFPQLTKISGRYSGIVAKRWLELVRKLGVYRQGRHPLHGFRHTFKTTARSVGIPKEVSDWITGHTSGGVGDEYGTNPLSRMADEIKKLPSIARAAGLLPEN